MLLHVTPFHAPDSYFLMKTCGVVLAASYLCRCYGSAINTIIHIKHLLGELKKNLLLLAERPRSDALMCFL